MNDDVSTLAGGPALSEFQELTVALSHELSETIADPVPGTGWDEIGDLAEQHWVTYHGYAMQEVWGRDATDPPGLALGPAEAPADTNFAVTHLNPTEGAFDGVLATFADKDSASEPPNQFKVGVEWADGAISRTDDGSGDVTVTSNGDGTFNVVGRHTYNDAGTTGYASVFVSSGDEIAWNFSPNTLQRATFTVTSPLDDGGVGTLRWAVGQANSTTAGLATINFAPDEFNTPRTITLSGAPLGLSNSSAIEAITGPAAGVTVSGGGLSRVFQVGAGVNAALSGLTIIGGRTDDDGGGLSNLGTVRLTNCTVSGNAAYEGGGLWSSGKTTLSNCTVSGNTASFGGGLETYSGDTTLTHCTVTGNSARFNGGGLDNFGSQTTTLTNCSVSGNSASSGGGVSNFGPHTVTLKACTVSGNSARSGGGLANYGAATLFGCTVSGNSALRNGGGLANSGGAALVACTVSGNNARDGGGLFTAYGGEVTLFACTVSGNNATRTGGALLNGGTATLTNCTVSGNVARAGGGLLSYGTLRLAGCTVSGNAARYGGGLLSSGTLRLTGCTVSGNAASVNGGGVYVNYGTAALTNCTVSGNTAANYGGGLDFYSGSASLTNCTVSGNTAAHGGGLYAFNNQYSVFGPLTLTNTIVAGNTNPAAAASDIRGSAAGANNLIGTGGSGGLVNGVNGNLVGVANALLAPLGDYGGPTQTMPLLPGSPALDAGITAGAPAFDQRGQGRVGAVDIGAFESQGFTLAVTSGGGQATDIATAFAAPLLVTVTANNPIEPVAGGLVAFTPPSSGVSATLGGSPAIIGPAGTASVTATANGFAGSYTVSATAKGITTPASFGLSNRPTITVPAAQTAYQNVDQPINGILIGDAPSATLTVTLSVGHGTLTLGTTTGLTSVTGNSSNTVTLTGATAALNAALASLVYSPGPNYSGGDTLSITATDSGVSATPAAVALTVESSAQQAADLQARVSALQAAGVLNQGQANSLLVKLDLKGNNGDIGKVQAFLNEVVAEVQASILTQCQADALLSWGNILLLSVTRR